MTGPDLPATLEGDLIRRARDRAVPKLSIRRAAARIGISPEHWGNIERGHKSAGATETPRPLSPSASMLAKMAGVVGVTPGELAEAGRQDAARELEEMQRRRPLAVVPPPPRETVEPLDALPADEAAAAGPLAKAIEELAGKTRKMNPGRKVTGADIFDTPGDIRARLWDAIVRTLEESLPGEYVTDKRVAGLLAAELSVRQHGGLAAG